MNPRKDGQVEGSVGPITLSQERHQDVATFTVTLKIPATYNEGQVHNDLHQLVLAKYPGTEFI